MVGDGSGDTANALWITQELIIPAYIRIPSGEVYAVTEIGASSLTCNALTMSFEYKEARVYIPRTVKTYGANCFDQYYGDASGHLHIVTDSPVPTSVYAAATTTVYKLYDPLGVVDLASKASVKAVADQIGDIDTALDSIIAVHCEDMSWIPAGGAIHDGAFAKAHGIPGIPSESEWKPIERDIALCRETGCRYHVCHVSTKESVALIRQAKAEGVNITCETGPHYLLLCQDDLQDLGRFKMNPPLRNKDDQEALLAGLLDGTIDMIATDHAPHSAEEKAKGLRGSAMGVVGIETAFPLLYTYLVETGKMPLEMLIDRMADAPRRRFRIDGGMQVGDKAAVTVFDLHAQEKIDPNTFLSKGRATPFEGWKVHAACRLTICGDKIAYNALSRKE